MTEIEVQNILYKSYLSSNNLLIAPCSFVFGWEADLVIITKALLSHEFEIKLSRQDFLKDKKKEKHEHIQKYITGIRQYKRNYFNLEIDCRTLKPANYFWYVCPENMIKVEELPEYAGLIELLDKGWINTKKKAPRLHGDKLDNKEIMQICRNMAYRYWDQRLKLTAPE